MRGALRRLAGRVDGTLLRFGIVGIITTTLDLGLFTALLEITALPVVSNIGSYSCGIVVSYLLNRAWTFGVDGDIAQAMRFLLFICTGLVISTLLVAAISMAIAPIAAKLISVPIVFFWNYLTSRYLVFQRQSPASIVPD